MAGRPKLAEPKKIFNITLTPYVHSVAFKASKSLVMSFSSYIEFLIKNANVMDFEDNRPRRDPSSAIVFSRTAEHPAREGREGGSFGLSGLGERPAGPILVIDDEAIARERAEANLPPLVAPVAHNVIVTDSRPEHLRKVYKDRGEVTL